MTSTMDRRMVLAIRLLAGVGAVLSFYLTYLHYRLHRDPNWHSACDISDVLSCDAAIAGSVGQALGVPLPILGAWSYCVVLVVMTLEGHGKTGAVLRSPALGVFVIAALASIVSVVLAVVSIGVLQLLCPLCAVIYILNFGLLVVSWRALLSTGETIHAALAAERRHWSRSARGLAAVGLALGALLVAHASYSRWTAGGSGLCGVIAAALHSSSTPIEVKVYSDFQCPYCKALNLDLRRIRDSSALHVRQLPFPIDKRCNPIVRGTGHAGACLQARAGLCAESQGRGAAFSELVFDTEVDQRSALVALAAGVGLAGSSFDECLDADATSEKLDTIIRDALDLGVRATPTVVVENWVHVGRLDGDDIRCLDSASRSARRVSTPK